jgi:hypothetical protein
VERLGDEGEFDLIPTLGPVVMDIAAHSFMGREFHEKLGHEFFDLFRDFSGGMEFVLPLWLPTPKMVKSQAAKRKLHAILQSWIDKRRAAPLDPPDFFQTMIETVSGWPPRARRDHPPPDPVAGVGRARDYRRASQLGTGRPAAEPGLRASVAR